VGRFGRLVLWTVSIVALLVLLGAAGLGTWLYTAARHKGAPDNAVDFVAYPDPRPPPGVPAPPRFAPRKVGDRFEIVDHMGRVAYFRGVNIGQGGETPPFRPIEMGDETAFLQLQAWGFNAIRLVVPWEALEPAPRTFNMEHLAYVRWFLDQALVHGMVVLLDNHQAEASRCLGGDGAPRWAHRPGTIRQAALDKDCRYLGSPALADLPLRMRWWADFYDGSWSPDDLSLQDHAIWAWQKLAEVVGGHPALLGYDPLDAPPCSRGTLGRTFDPVEGRCEAALSAFYDRFATAIRAVDSDALLFFEPPAGRFEAGWDGKATDVTRPKLDGAVFSVQYLDGDDSEATCDSTFRRDDCRLAEFLDATGRLAETRFAAPRVLTSFGVLPCKEGAVENLAHAMVDIEDASASSFVWNYFKNGEPRGMTGFREGGEDRSLVVPAVFAESPAQVGAPRCIARAMIRPYPMRVSGANTRWSFDRSFEDPGGPASDRHHDGSPVTGTDVFTLTFDQTDKATDTFVWVPRYSVYGDDPSTEAPEFTVDVSDGRWQWSPNDPNLLVWTPNAAVDHHVLKIAPWGGRRAPGRGIDGCVER